MKKASPHSLSGFEITNATLIIYNLLVFVLLQKILHNFNFAEESYSLPTIKSLIRRS